jgi:hypothetical protein
MIVVPSDTLFLKTRGRKRIGRERDRFALNAARHDDGRDGGIRQTEVEEAYARQAEH